MRNTNVLLDIDHVKIYIYFFNHSRLNKISLKISNKQQTDSDWVAGKNFSRPHAPSLGK